MDRIFRIKMNDGYVKEFTDEKLALEFEAKVKKETEEEVERQRKATELKQTKEANRKVLKKEIDELTEKLNTKVSEYKSVTGDTLGYVLVNGVLKTKEHMTLDDAFDIPYYWTHTGTNKDLLSQIYKALGYIEE